MKAYPLKGMGGKGDIMSFLMKGVVPNLMKSVGISPSAIPLTKIAPMVSKALELAKSGDLASVISNLTKTLLPILTHGKMKTIGVKMSGQGIMDVVHSSGLDKKLASGLFNAFKYHRNRMAVAQGKRPPYPKVHSGSGLNLPGGSWGSFWKGFKKGFVSVFKPGAQILGTVASALGQPEFGIPLTAIAGAI
jgi:hypothetical protein